MRTSKCKIQSCRGVENCLEHCPCDCHNGATTKWIVVECSNCKLEVAIPNNITLTGLNDEADRFFRQHATRIGNVYCKKINLHIHV